MKAARALMVPLMVVLTISAGAQVPDSASRYDLKIPLSSVSLQSRVVTQSSWGRELRVEFPSPYVSGVPINDEVVLRVFLPLNAEGETQKEVPAVLVMHYLGAADLRVERGLAEELARRGIASAILSLPYHLDRTPEGKNSGDLAIVPDPESIRNNLVQAVLDARRALDLISQIPEVNEQKLGVAGISLGAIVSSLLYGVDDRLERAAFVLGGVDLAHILWRSSRVVQQRDVLRSKGYTEASLREELAAVEPLNFLKPKGETLVIQARYDSVIPSAASDSLIRALDTPHVSKLATGHYGGIFVQRRIHREVAEFFSIQFSGKEYRAPKVLAAPTLRIGALLTTNSALDLGVGFDVLRLDPAGQSALGFFVTPRGPMATLGTRFDRNLSAGLVYSRKGLGLGVFWSMVL